MFNVDLTLLSIAIVFPLVFSIRGSFRRREKALEHLSQFRSSLKTVNNYINSDTRLSAEHKSEMKELLCNISTHTLEHLKNNTTELNELDDTVDFIEQFIVKYRESLSAKSKDRVLRYLNDLQEAIDNLHAINTHRTPRSLRAYCLIFIFLFPLIYAPVIINNVGGNTPHFISFAIVMVTQFILVSLYNIQNDLEYPFDNRGLDDINLEGFKMDRKECP
ncbi:hypothetical protein [Aegicerativicinus sediminis]